MATVGRTPAGPLHASGVVAPRYEDGGRAYAFGLRRATSSSLAIISMRSPGESYPTLFGAIGAAAMVRRSPADLLHVHGAADRHEAIRFPLSNWHAQLLAPRESS
jgi:hypothetical protein